MFLRARLLYSVSNLISFSCLIVRHQRKLDDQILYFSIFNFYFLFFFLQATFQNSFTNLSFVISWIKGNKINWKNKKFELKKIFYPFSKSSSTFTSRIFYILPWIFKEKKYVRSIFNSSSTRKLYDKGKESTAQLLQKKGEKNEMVY